MIGKIRIFLALSLVVVGSLVLVPLQLLSMKTGIWRETGQGAKPPVGFVLARLAAGEGEILTVAVARSHRRQGLGWQLMDAVLRELHAQRAEALFLEVDETNVAAIALYRRLGFREVGKRANYYRSPERGPTGALVMRRDLR